MQRKINSNLGGDLEIFEIIHLCSGQTTEKQEQLNLRTIFLEIGCFFIAQVQSQ